MAEKAPNQKSRSIRQVSAGGCAAKVSASQLSEIVRSLPAISSPNLLTDLESFEDAAVYKVSEDVATIQTVDFFPPVVDSPYWYGRIAAANALSDVYAMGGRPVIALNILCFPVCDYPLTLATDILKGALDTLSEASCALAGGHTIQSNELIYGMSVTGLVHPQKILTNGGGKDGDALVLSKPIGVGVLLLADKGELLNQSEKDSLYQLLASLNAQALDAASSFEIHAATDVTGFGLIGHLHELGKASGLAAHLNASRVPLFARAEEFVAQGILPAAAYANRKSYEDVAAIGNEVELSLSDLLFDPQTSGGLLMALPANQADALVQAMTAKGLTAAKIGSLFKGQAGKVEVSAK